MLNDSLKEYWLTENNSDFMLEVCFDGFGGNWYLNLGLYFR
jgi:hypothetical protein